MQKKRKEGGEKEKKKKKKYWGREEKNVVMGYSHIVTSSTNKLSRGMECCSNSSVHTLSWEVLRSL